MNPETVHLVTCRASSGSGGTAAPEEWAATAAAAAAPRSSETSAASSAAAAAEREPPRGCVCGVTRFIRILRRRRSWSSARSGRGELLLLLLALLLLLVALVMLVLVLLLRVCNEERVETEGNGEELLRCEEPMPSLSWWTTYTRWRNERADSKTRAAATHRKASGHLALAYMGALLPLYQLRTTSALVDTCSCPFRCIDGFPLMFECMFDKGIANRSKPPKTHKKKSRSSPLPVSCSISLLCLLLRLSYSMP